MSIGLKLLPYFVSKYHGRRRVLDLFGVRPICNFAWSHLHFGMACHGFSLPSLALLTALGVHTDPKLLDAPYVPHTIGVGVVSWNFAVPCSFIR